MQRLTKFLLYMIGTIYLLFLVSTLAISIYKVKDLNRKFSSNEVQEDVARYKVAPHVIKIEIKIPDAFTYSTGTGFHVRYGDKIVIVTNKHICDPAEEGMLLEADGQSLEIIAISQFHDLCLIKSDRQEGLELASLFVNLQPLDKVILVGHPRGLPLTIRKGRISHFDMAVFPWIGEAPLNFFEITATSYGGNSGSPVTNLEGEVIGVLFAGYRNSHTEGMVVPLTSLYFTLFKYSNLY